MKAYRITRYYRGLTIYHTNDRGRVVMTTVVRPDKGLDQEERKQLVLARLKSEGIEVEEETCSS